MLSHSLGFVIENVFWQRKVIGENTKTCEIKLTTILSEKKFENFWDFWGQKFRNHVILYAQKWICVVVCSIKNVFWRLKVIGENKKTCENNLVTILSKKKILKFFWNFWGQKFRKYVILYAQKMDFLQLQGGVKKFLGVLWRQTKIPMKPET